MTSWPSRRGASSAGGFADGEGDCQKDYHLRRANNGIRSLNPLYILAHQKLPLPWAYTYLVDHHGNVINEDVDERIPRSSTRCWT